MFERREVLNIVDDDAFEYGFFSGHEDYTLIGDPVADVLISFPHRTVEEFFGAFSLVLTLEDGIDIESVPGLNSSSPIFMTNHYVLEFCLFAISYIREECKRQTNVKEVMIEFILKRINLPQLEMSSIAFLFPALCWTYAALRNDEIVTKFLKDVFSKCSGVRILLFDSVSVSNGIIDAVGPLLAGLHCIYLTLLTSESRSNIPFPESCPDNLNKKLLICHKNNRILKKVMSYLVNLNKNICLFVHFTETNSQTD